MASPPTDSLADLQLVFASINNIVYAQCVKSSEFKRWLAKQGVTFGAQEGSHIKLYLNGKQSFLPMHGKDLGAGLLPPSRSSLD
jgi:mRNA interferase HicA